MHARTFARHVYSREKFIVHRDNTSPFPPLSPFSSLSLARFTSLFYWIFMI